jgi:hypothetical protein
VSLRENQSHLQVTATFAQTGLADFSPANQIPDTFLTVGARRPAILGNPAGIVAWPLVRMGSET